MQGTLGPWSVSTKQQRIAELAKRAPDMCITTLAHHIDLEWMKEAYRRTRKDGATGVDGQSAGQYAKNLEENLRNLLDRAKSGDGYRAPPVRRVLIPKGNGEMRPIGVPTFEDKVLQRAVAMLLESVYEQDFRDCSYGFRPGRGAHQALEAFRTQMRQMRGGWVLEVDLRKFFDTLDHRHIQELVSKRIGDGVLKRLIGKWLNAGVMTDGNITYPEAGTPQGGVISPLLANIYLHEVLDVWFEDEVRPRLRGHAFLVRYADDFVIGFALEEDAQKVMAVLPKRMAKYGLTVHPEKTRLVQFQKPRNGNGPGPGSTPPGTFDFLGFTHYWAQTKDKKAWAIFKKTARSRLRRALTGIADWCRKARHLRFQKQHAILSKKLTGHAAYYGVKGNSRSLQTFAQAVRRIWKEALGRRSQQGMTWERFHQILKRHPLPQMHIVH